ncbi:MAG: UDP-glucose 6-dehydrogenase [bacterium]|nr:UDP-glucose 6-dehydrogenase [bacterium]
MNVGVIGCGVIGGALIKWIEENNSEKCNILRVDPPKGLNDDISKADAIFVSIHIPTEDDLSQDLTTLENIIDSCPDVPIYIRTTLKPGTCDMLSKKHNKQINFMPEFLTERTAVSDFYSQPMVFTNNEELLKEIFVGKEYVCMSSLEAEVAKYAHNVFGALKVTYFNGIYEYCQKLGIDYENVHNGVLLSGYINEPHTLVPGPDGRFGYGGKCFPKDVNAFIECIKDTELYDIMKLVPLVNGKYRK